MDLNIDRVPGFDLCYAHTNIICVYIIRTLGSYYIHTYIYICIISISIRYFDVFVRDCKLIFDERNSSWKESIITRIVILDRMIDMYLINHELYN